MIQLKISFRISCLVISKGGIYISLSGILLNEFETRIAAEVD